MQLSGKKALVTGAQQGIGRAIAVRFAKEGADVALNYLDDAGAAKAVATEIKTLGSRAFLVMADIGKGDEIERLVDQADAALGGIDILVNNAGIFPRAYFMDITEDIWDRTQRINLRGTCFVSQAVVRRMVQAGTKGSIINLSSSAIQGLERSAHYAASKAGIVSLTRTMALELASHDIRVNAIAPGLTDTAQPRGGFNEEQLQEIARSIPMHRMGTANDVAGAALFLASNDANYITGQILHVNGGAFMA